LQSYGTGNLFVQGNDFLPKVNQPLRHFCCPKNSFLQEKQLGFLPGLRRLESRTAIQLGDGGSLTSSTLRISVVSTPFQHVNMGYRPSIFHEEFQWMLLNMLDIKHM